MNTYLLLSRIPADATAECIDVQELLAGAQRLGAAMTAYASQLPDAASLLAVGTTNLDNANSSTKSLDGISEVASTGGPI